MAPPGGPTTPEGRAISARNSLKHGLTARAILLPGESEDEWLHLRDALVLTYLPVGPVEAGLVFRMAEIQWRLARVALAEQQAALHRAEHPELYESIRMPWSKFTVYHSPAEAPEMLPPGLPAPASTKPIIRHEAHLWRQHRMVRNELDALQARRLRKPNADLKVDLDALPLSDAGRHELGLEPDPPDQSPGEK